MCGNQVIDARRELRLRQVAAAGKNPQAYYPDHANFLSHLPKPCVVSPEHPLIVDSVPPPAGLLLEPNIWRRFIGHECELTAVARIAFG
jgi:hypothetical protein